MAFSKVTVVKFDPLGKGVVAVYIDGKLYVHGQGYHNTMDNWVDGFIEGLRYAGAIFEMMETKVEDDDWLERVVDNGEAPPRNLEELKGSY